MTSFRALASAMVMIIGVSGAFAPSTRAELAAVSGVDGPVGPAGNPEDVAVFPAAPWDFENEELLPGNEEGDFRGAGFPVWYEDTTGLQLTLCLDGEEEGFPCGWEGSPVFTNSTCTERLYPYQDVVGFGDEAFYYKATSFPFDVPLANHPVPGASAQLALLLETTWSGDTRFDENTGRIGDQDIFIESEDGTCESAVGGDLHRVAPGSELLFTRIRLRLLGDQAGHAGWYRITYPYGVKTFYHLPEAIDANNGDDRSQVRQQIGDFRVGVPQDYTIALNDPGAFDDDPNSPFIDVGNSNVTDIDDSFGFSNDASVGLKNIGPFLYKPEYWTDEELQIPILDRDGIEIGFHQYIGNPIEALGGHEVVGAPYEDPQGPLNDGTPTFANYFKIEYLAGTIGTPPDADAEGWAIVGFTDLFNVAGKVANCSDPENLAPQTFNDFAVAIRGGEVIVPVLDNDDPEGSASPIRTTSVIVASDPEVISSLDAEAGAGTAQVNADGTVTFMAPDTAGEFTLTYQVSDQCGLLSAPASVTIIVEDLEITQAQLRLKTGKWLIQGTTSEILFGEDSNEITLYAGEVSFSEDGEAEGTVIGTASVDNEGNWVFAGKSSASPAAGIVTAVSSLGVATETFDLVLR